jgi:hypothetical protein
VSEQEVILGGEYQQKQENPKKTLAATKGGFNRKQRNKQDRENKN